MKVNYAVEKLIQEATLDPNIHEVGGVLFTWTGTCTGRSPNAKRFELIEKSECLQINWQKNDSITPKAFDSYWEKFRTFFAKNAEEIYFENVSAVRDPSRRLTLSIYTEFPQHALFARNMFISEDNFPILSRPSDYDVYHFPSLLDEPTVLISVAKKKILISGTYYSGEIKKSVFSVLNYHFPMAGDLPMHCSVNVDLDRKDPAIFFGLSGTGKTTLSSDSNRILIGDDEHAWTSDGITNFEGGCYAKTINLSKDDEPEIWSACHTPGTIIENVVLNNNIPDFDDSKYTENGRASYAVSSIQNADKLGYVNLHPKNIIMLTCDAFGVLPPVSKLTTEQAVKHFSMGYTAKVAGTEAGITEPVATFSPCFGGPFMPLHVEEYANILRQKIEHHNVTCWLVNTGWVGGPYGTGNRISIKLTRTIIDAILDGTLVNEPTTLHSYTGQTIPMLPAVDDSVLIPELGWADINDYKVKAAELMSLFDSYQ